jgi:CBS domain-containing protein
MWDRDVGCLPVVDESNRLLGLITDRDACLAAYARDEPLRNISVKSAMATRVFACGPDEDLLEVQRTMAAHKVRRVPVLDPSGHLVGLLSVDDLARAATLVKDLPLRSVVTTLQSVSGNAPQLDPDC